MKVSVIVPVYNVEPYVHDCLNSVGRQAFDGDIECIVVDDCGTDNSMEIVDGYIRDYRGPVKFKVVRREANGGLSAARNSGLENATGDYIYFLDSDDELTLGAIKAIARPLSNGQEYDVVIANYRTVGGDRQMPRLALDPDTIIAGVEILKSYLQRKWYMMAPNKLYRHAFLKENKFTFLEGVIHEDELWSFQIALRAKSLYVVEGCTYLYKLREGSITTSVNHRKRAESFADMFCQTRNDVYGVGKQREKKIHQYMQRVFRNSLVEAGKLRDEALFQCLYHKMRRLAPIKFSDAVLANGGNPAEWLMNFHWLLPEQLAEKVLWQHFKRVDVK
jgi:hypothetical protein